MRAYIRSLIVTVLWGKVVQWSKERAFVLANLNVFHVHDLVVLAQKSQDFSYKEQC
jgi:hypothetical protein